MGFWDKVPFLGGKKTLALELPIQAGSQAVDTSLPGLLQISADLRLQFGYIRPVVPMEFIDVLMALSVANPLISEVVWDAVTLANSGHSLQIDGESERAVDEAMKQLNALGDAMHKGGVHSWAGVAFYQTLVTGALSHEWVVAPDLKGLVRDKFIPVQSIRFTTSAEREGDYVPLQAVGRVDGKVVELNPLTYHYRPILQIENNPYGIPPYVAAIDALWIQKDILHQIKCIARKIGLMGLVQVLTTMPQQKPGETDTLYETRLDKHIGDTRKRLEKNLTGGIVVGFKDGHEIKVDSVTSESRGLAELYDRVDVQAHSGANTDPSMHGRAMSRTETHIKQIFQREVRRLKYVQGVVGSSLADGYNLHLQLAGVPAVTWIDWDKIDTFDRKADAEAEQIEIANARNLYDNGIITQEQQAQRLGYDTAAEDAPRTVAVAKLEGRRYKPVLPRINMLSAGHTKTDAIRVEFSPAWPTESPCGCDGCQHFERPLVQTSRFDKLDDMIDGYLVEMLSHVDDVTEETVHAIRKFLRNSGRRLPADQFANQMYAVLSSQYTFGMESDKARKIVDAATKKIYEEARMGSGFLNAIASLAEEDRRDLKPIFNVVYDTRTMNFVGETDFFYLGKYITRADTAERLTKAIKENYLSVGRDWDDPKFISKLSTDIGLERWQATRIIRTTGNMTRNFAKLRTYEQIGLVQQYQITGPNDSRKCAWCRAMLGRTFSVSLGISNMNYVIDGGPRRLPERRGILNSSVDIDSLAGNESKGIARMSDKDVQRRGFDLPSFHPSCRDTIVPVVD